jgi:hypothetical protein
MRWGDRGNLTGTGPGMVGIYGGAIKGIRFTDLHPRLGHFGGSDGVGKECECPCKFQIWQGRSLLRNGLERRAAFRIGLVMRTCRVFDMRAAFGDGFDGWAHSSSSSCSFGGGGGMGGHNNLSLSSNILLRTESNRGSE